ncbi:hypothetical protein FEI13_17235 [Halomonas urmiana]|uniref:Uncharacterized protein n=1 Tax=Halomonas urmiana TaxID=490901 RepID=A0A5R8M8X0_9GAMM|nr:hypothetical protein [Halomonas urmiana]TLF46033.1 hypothetical protein FEI13_17235 [Halomonas urmiana]
MKDPVQKMNVAPCRLSPAKNTLEARHTGCCDGGAAAQFKPPFEPYFNSGPGPARPGAAFLSYATEVTVRMLIVRAGIARRVDPVTPEP